MPLVGYVSDERYVAIADVAVEFLSARGESVATHSRATGGVWVDLPPGDYDVVFQKAGFGSKRSRVTLPTTQPLQFRLLTDGLLGYAWPKCVRSGEQSEFRVHSVEQYHLELWRYGWKKELVRRLGWFDEHGPRAVMQIVPDGDYSQTGVEWNKTGYASLALKQFTTAPERSGLYYFHARTNSGREFGFPWVVAPAKPRAKTAVLLSNITWNAYNNFGGRSNYIHADELPPTPTINARQELKRYIDDRHQTWGCPQYLPLSFDRPELINHIDLAEQITDPIEGRAACHIAPAEWRLLGWMEREGFDHDVYSETQFDAGVLDLSQYKLLIISTHPEYWTRTMYERLKRWVFEEGGRLMYLGGNGVNCEVEVRDDRLVCHNGNISSLWAEGIGAESRMAKRVESEANLLGVVFTMAGIMTSAPYRTIAADHWVFEGTGLKAGDLFGTESLHKRCPGGASGHETDKISPLSSPKDLVHLAKGTNPDEGGADMVLFDTPSGGRVFSVGSITWPSCLPVDVNVSKITANVIRRFAQ